MYTYKNISDSTQDLVGHGTVEAGQEITVQVAIENPNFLFVREVQDEAKITGVVQQSENAVTQAQEIVTTEGAA